MEMQEPPVSHVDIYHKLGSLEGKLDALITRTTEYRNDLQTAFNRISTIENRLAWVMGGAAVISIVVPVLMNFVFSNFNLKFEQPHKHPTATIVKLI